LNFLAFRAAFSASGSPLASFSAPMFLPLEGQPVLLDLNKLQETAIVIKQKRANMARRFFMRVIELIELK
jgi:hypothetical protein